MPNIDKSFADEKTESPGHSTGPRTSDGKARSSMNRLTHGCRSEKTVLPHEDPAEFEFTVQSWTQAYNADDPTIATLAHETAKAHWFFQRNQQRLDQFESRLPADPCAWSAEDHKSFQNFTRYKTTAERSFYRAFNTLEAHCKRQADRQAHRALEARCARSELAHAERARAQMAKIHMEWLKKKSAAAAKDLCARQWVEIAANAQGECITTFAPTNEEIAEQFATRAADSDRPLEFVTRFICFLNGVPPAYEWTNPNDMQRYEQTMGIQQFTYSGWLRQIEAEKVAATGHLEPYTTGLLGD